MAAPTSQFALPITIQEFAVNLYQDLVVLSHCDLVGQKLL